MATGFVFTLFAAGPYELSYPEPNDRDTDDVSADVPSPLHPPAALYSGDVMVHVEAADPRDAPHVMEIITLCIQHMRARGIDQWDEIYPICK